METLNSKTIRIILALLTMVSCSEEEFTKPESDSLSVSSEQTLASARSYGRYNIDLKYTSGILIYGTTATISGVVSKDGKRFSNQTFGISDGIGLRSTKITTDKQGKFSYSTTVQTNSVSVVELLFDNVTCPIIFQTAKKSNGSYLVKSFYAEELKFKNQRSKNLTIQTSVKGALKYSQRLAAKSTQKMMQLKRRPKLEVSNYGGHRINFIVGSITYTVDENMVATTSITAGEGLFRGQVYGTSNDDIGVCWAPGAQINFRAIDVEGGVLLCIGTDGGSVSLGGSGSYGGYTSGFSIKVLD